MPFAHHHNSRFLDRQGRVFWTRFIDLTQNIWPSRRIVSCAKRFYVLQSNRARDTREWRVFDVLIYDSAILEYRMKREIPVELQWHLVKTKTPVVGARENPTSVSNKVNASMAFPFWPRLPAGVENPFVKCWLRRAYSRFRKQITPQTHMLSFPALH